MKKFSKEQNDLKIQQVQEFSRDAAGPYPLNLYVHGLNYSLTEAEMKKSHYSMASRFHPDKNFGLDTTEMMKMINEGMDWETNCVLMMQVGKKNVSDQQKI